MDRLNKRLNLVLDKYIDLMQFIFFVLLLVMLLVLFF